MEIQRTFIIQEVSHISCSIIYLEEEKYFPKDLYLSDTESNLIDGLAEITDLYFVIPNGLSHKINSKKFASLYKAKGYTILPDENETPGVIGLIDYLINIFNKHINIFYINDIKSLAKLNSMNDLLLLQGAQLSKSVFTCQRLLPSQMSEIYIETSKKESWLDKFNPRKKLEDLNGMFCTHCSPDNILMIKSTFFVDVLKKTSDLYRDTFKDYTFETFISSVIDRLGKETYLLNHTITEVMNMNRDEIDKE